MAKEWILNQANMRWGLTKKTKVGAVSEAIRLCGPKSLSDWEKYYFEQHLPERAFREFRKNLIYKNIGGLPG